MLLRNVLLQIATKADESIVCPFCTWTSSECVGREGEEQRHPSRCPCTCSGWNVCVVYEPLVILSHPGHSADSGDLRCWKSPAYMMSAKAPKTDCLRPAPGAKEMRQWKNPEKAIGSRLTVSNFEFPTSREIQYSYVGYGANSTLVPL